MTETTNASAATGGSATGRGITVDRLFTTPGVHPYDEVTWERRDVVQTNWKTGEVVFEQRGVEFPDFWSVNASTIVTTKYFRGAVGTEQREAEPAPADRPRGVDVRQGGPRVRLLRHRRGCRDLRARTDLDAAAPGVLLQLSGVVQRRHHLAAAGQRLLHPQPSTTPWIRSSTGTARRA